MENKVRERVAGEGLGLTAAGVQEEAQAGREFGQVQPSNFSDSPRGNHFQLCC